MTKQIFLFVHFLGCTLMLFAQSDTTLNLNPISITSTQIRHFEKGRTVFELDTTVILSYSGTTLDEILSKETGVFIKERSPGNLSTPSIRGTGYGHVAVLWNGFPIQSPMNGGIDFALVGVDDYNHISLLKGGNSAIYGSGAIGGTISLENNLQLSPKQIWTGGINSNVNSNNDYGFHALAQSSSDRLAFNLKMNYQNNQNKFRYGNKHKIQENAHHIFESYATNLLFKLNKHHFLKLWALVNQANRDIAPSRTSAYNDEKMFTTTARIGVDWSILNQHSKQTIRLGLFRDSLNFSSVSIHSYNNTFRFIGQFLSKHFLKNNINVEWGMNYNYANTRGNNILHETRNQWALFTNFSYEWHQWSTSFSMRDAILDEKLTPFTFTWGHQYQISEKLQLKGNISKNFRAPTFNDLYWPGLGNPNLKSEKGWSGEIGIQYVQNNINLSLTYFGIQGIDWIIWSPNQMGLWMPNNNLKVVSQGLETGLKFTKSYGKWIFSLNSGATYVHSVLKEKYSNQSDADIGKQLIYVPKFRANLSLNIDYQKFRINYHQGFTSSVRTTQKQLDGYSIGSLRLGYHSPFFRDRLFFSFDIKNIWNKNYEVVAYYPMPLRYFAFGINFRY